MALLEFQAVSKTYRRAEALRSVDLRIEADALTVVCGPPQCGKSVLMRLLVGLEAPSSGRILLDGEDLTALPPGQRRIGYVPQSFALYPHMSVFSNIAYPLKLHRAPRDHIAAQVARVAELLDIEPLLRKTPDQLSGGEKQRTAVARGLLNEAEIFVLDDPLVGLDFKLRERLMEDLRDMRRRLATTFIYATSDPLEALMMADRLAVMDLGRIVEHDAVDRIYGEPTRLRSAQLIGFPTCNVVSGRYRHEDGVCSAELFAFPVDDGRGSPASGDVSVALRPEDVRLGAVDDGGLRGSAEVRLVEDLGGECVVYLERDGTQLTTTVRAGTESVPPEGSRVQFTVDPERLIVFDAATGERIGRGRNASNA